MPSIHLIIAFVGRAKLLHQIDDKLKAESESELELKLKLKQELELELQSTEGKLWSQQREVIKKLVFMVSNENYGKTTDE